MTHIFNPTDILEALSTMSVSYLLVLLAVAIDTATGVAKSRRERRPIKSSIIRRMFAKLLVYYGLILMFSFVDVLLFTVDLPLTFGLKELPYLTALGAIGAVATEGWSVWENMPRHDKEHIEDGLEQTKQLLEQLNSLVSKAKQLQSNDPS